MHSSDNDNSKKTVLTVIKLAAFLVTLLLISRLLSFLLMLPLGYSRTIMHESTLKDYDCIVIGSSEAMYAFDTATFDKIRGTDSFILGTEATYLNGGEWASFNDYMKDHKGEHAPKTVIVMQGNFEILNSGDEDPTSYSLLMPCLNHLSSKLDYYRRVCSADDLWLERLLYWKDAINKDVAENVSIKCSSDYMAYGHRQEDEDIRYVGKGQISRDSSVKSNVIDYAKAAEEGMDRITEYDPVIDAADINPVYPDTLREIAEVCKEEGMRLVLVTAPLPVTEYYDDEYYLRHLILELMADELDVEFYDLNMASDELYSPDPYGFYDNYHTNDTGAVIYTQALAGMLDMVDEGSVPDNAFITWGETCHRAEEFLDRQGIIW